MNVTKEKNMYAEETTDGYYSPEKTTESRPALPLPEQEKVIAMLEGSIDLLSTKLEPVLGADYPTAGTTTEPTEADDKSPTRRRLDNNNDHLRRLNRRLENLIERLEV